MFSKYSLSLLVAGFFVFSFIVFSSPEKASAGAALGPGCCINNGGNCNPGCGSKDDACFRDGSGGIESCPNVKSGDCGGIDAIDEDRKCFVDGDICLQVENNTGLCVPAIGACCREDVCTQEEFLECGEGGLFVGVGAACEEGTCEVPPEPDCTEETADADCSPDTCFDATCPAGMCVFTRDDTNDPEFCAPEEPEEPEEPAGPVTIIPTMGQWGMIAATILLGFFAVRMLRNRKDSEI